MARRTNAALVEQLEAARKDLEEASGKVAELRKLLQGSQAELSISEQRRVSAQRGLTPYVYAVQALNAWLGERPALLEQITPVLRELGLLGVKVGYDPDRDLALSIISPSRSKQ